MQNKKPTNMASDRLPKRHFEYESRNKRAEHGLVSLHLGVCMKDNSNFSPLCTYVSVDDHESAVSIGFGVKINLSQ